MTPRTAKGTERAIGQTVASVPAIRPTEAAAGLRDDPYRLILEELYRKRSEIDAAIAAIEQVASPATADAIDVAPRTQAASTEPHQPISSALVAAMRDLGGSARNGDIKAALNRSGYRFRGDPTVSVAQCLVRLAHAGVVTKLDRGVWKLRPGADKVRL